MQSSKGNIGMKGGKSLVGNSPHLGRQTAAGGPKAAVGREKTSGSLIAGGAMDASSGPSATTTAAVKPSHDSSTTGRPKQPSLATLMMLKRRIGDLRAKHRRNRPVIRLENSYRLGPEPSKRYLAGEVRPILENSLRFFLAESRYDPKASPKLAKMITEDVKRRMKNNFDCPRYKLVVMATVAQRTHQQALSASRTVSDAEHDGFVSCKLERPTFLACATAFWFYCE